MPDQWLVVTGGASTALLLRVINLVAVQNLTLRSLEARMMGESLRIRIGYAARAGRPIDAVIERLRSFVEVSEVEIG